MRNTKKHVIEQTSQYRERVARFSFQLGEKKLRTSALLLIAFLVGACGGIGPPSADSPTGPATGSELPPSEGKVAIVGAENVGEFPIEVTYFTPIQTEGPYYPVAKPADRDNDLVVLEGAAGRPTGDLLEFGGTLFDSTGMPVVGAVIEIWQTDDSGAYLHPNDPSSSRRDVNFQSYGESVTGENGGYSFRTILPGGYDQRPRHIHVKVWLDGQELLTTQFYFSNDPEAAKDRIFAGAGEEVEALIMEVEEGFDFEGNPALVGRRDIILRDNLSD